MAFPGDKENLGDVVCLAWGGGAACRGGLASLALPVWPLPGGWDKGCCLCTAWIGRVRNSEAATDDFTVAVKGELAGEAKYLQAVKTVCSGVLRRDWDYSQRSLGWPRCTHWVLLL